MLKENLLESPYKTLSAHMWYAVEVEHGLGVLRTVVIYNPNKRLNGKAY